MSVSADNTPHKNATLGCLAIDDNDTLGFITSASSLADDETMVKLGTTIVQPSVKSARDLGKPGISGPIGVVEAAFLGNFPSHILGEPYFVNAAFVALNQDLAKMVRKDLLAISSLPLSNSSFLGISMDYAKKIFADAPPRHLHKTGVVKYGRTSKKTHGTIKLTRFRGGSAMGDRPEGLIVIESRGSFFAQRGDSGALVTTEKHKPGLPVGIITHREFEEGTFVHRLALASPILPVMEALGIKQIVGPKSR